MEAKRLRLGFIASSVQLINGARQIAKEQDEDLELSSLGLDDAIPAGKEMQRSGVEVIVSRGGTSSLLRENLNIPVLSIPLNYFDILRGVKKASNLGNRIFLPTFRNPLSGIEIFEEIFNIELAQGTYDGRDSLEDLIINAQNEGYDVVIGGGVSMKMGKKHGIQVVMLETAKETISSVLEDAKSVAKSRREEQKKTQRYHSIIDATSEGIVAVDEDGHIITMNRTAKKLLKLKETDVNGKKVTHYIPNATILHALKAENPILNKLEKINKEQVIGNHIPIMDGSKLIGGVSTFKDISNVMEAENEVRRSFSKGLVAKYYMEDFVHKSPTIKDLLKKAHRYADSDSTILITGETGTGKEILAHAIHNLRGRKKGPFVSINCSALPDQLLESELFGYEEGAFTGSRKGGKPGLFEIAHSGTIFLDEIGTTPQNVQARLLRVLQEKEVMRIGGDRLIPIRVRVIAATNRNLDQEVQMGRFREDLFFRINVLNINIPPLRERVEDISPLVGALIERASKSYGVAPLRISEAFISRLTDFSWPGNVRQLENFLERLLLLSGSEFNTAIFKELYQELFSYPLNQKRPNDMDFTSLKDSLNMKNQEFESQMIWKAMAESDYCKSKAAERLGISRTTLWRKLKEIQGD